MLGGVIGLETKQARRSLSEQQPWFKGAYEQLSMLFV
jgi:hypothetical protein